MKVKLLSKKESNRILEGLNEQFSSSFSTQSILFMSGDDLCIAERSVFESLQERWRVNELGLYIGELRGGHVRLSIEGSQLVGLTATKNVLELSKEQVRGWMAGEVLVLPLEDSGFLIIKHGRDFLGCGKVKGGKLLNFVPKTRRVISLIQN